MAVKYELNDASVIVVVGSGAGGGTLSDEQWRRALLRSRAIEVRERWPVDVRFAVGMEVPRWLPSAVQIRAIADHPELSAAAAGSLHPSWCGNCSESSLLRGRYQELGMLPPGQHDLAFQVTVERGTARRVLLDREADHVPPGILWAGELRFRSEVAGTLEHLVPPVHDDSLDVSVRSLFQFAVFKEKWLRVSARHERPPALEGVAISLELDLLEDAAARETRKLFVLDRPTLSEPAAILELPEGLLDPGRWSIRVRGVPSGVLRHWRATRYWEGELVIPLADVTLR